LKGGESKWKWGYGSFSAPLTLGIKKSYRSETGILRGEILMRVGEYPADLTFFSDEVTFYPADGTYVYGVAVGMKDFEGLANAGILRFSFDRFTSSLKVIKVKEVFPYEGIEYMGWRFNDKLGGGGGGRVNYWLIKGLGGGEVSVYEVNEGGELMVEIPADTVKINLGLVRDEVNKRLGSIFTNMVKEELVSFLAGKGLELVGFVEGVWERTVNGDWVRPSVKGGIRYFVPLLDKEGYIISDWRGVPRAVYDEAGKEIWRGEFGPFGEPLYERGVVSNYIPFRLYGMYKDMETGLYYNVRRYYDWRVGRYLQPDPVSDLNLYVYANNSPYDLVDPVGMFKTEMKFRSAGPFAIGYLAELLGGWHVGSPIHEKITEQTINSSFCPNSKICIYGPTDGNWDFIPTGSIAGVLLSCRSPTNRIANGVNRVDCLWPLKSSFHCDNNDFAGCYEKTLSIESPSNSALLECYEIGGGGGSGGGGRSYSQGSGGGGCTIVNQRLRKKTASSWQCNFKSWTDYGALGQLLHPVQDFWSHSTALYVVMWTSQGKCIEYQGIQPLCDSSANCMFDPKLPKQTRDNCFIYYINYCKCLRYETIYNYRIERRWEQTRLPSDSEAKSKGLISGKFDSGGWGVVEDFICLGPPCDAHCVLNKDEQGGTYCKSACDPNCSWIGARNVQRFAFNDAYESAVASTRHYLVDKFCSIAPNLCY